MARFRDWILPATIFILVRSQASSFKTAVLPNDPTLWPGEDLVLNCTWHKPEENFTVKDMYFESKSKVQFNSTIIGNWTIQMVLKNMTEGTTIFCKVRDMYFGAQVVRIINNVTAPELTSCTVSRSSMNCSLWPTQSILEKDHDYMSVNVNFRWKFPTEPNWTDCPTLEQERFCIWRQANFRENETYMINISASHDYHSDSVTYTVDPQDYVKLDPVGSPTIRDINGTRVNISWPRPLAWQPLVYRLNISRPRLENSKKSLLLTKNEEIVVNLVPYKKYNFSVETKPEQSVHWSNPYRGNFNTLAEVPTKHPTVQKGAYSVSPKGEHCREVTVYFEALTEEEKNGPDLHYDVDVHVGMNCNETCALNKQNFTTHIKVEVPNDCSVIISIKAKNKEGVAKALPIPVQIPRSSLRLQGPENVTALASGTNEITLMWKNDSEEVNSTGFTVFWCLAKMCQLHWKKVNAETFSVHLNLTQEQRSKSVYYIFGVAREQGTVTSGMVLTQCTYNINNYSPAPKDFAISKLAQTQDGELALEWKERPCSFQDGYIYSYVISYCQTSEEECPEEATTDNGVQHVYLSGALTSYTLVGLEGNQRYCATIRSITWKGPSLTASPPQCGVVSGKWLTTGYIILFVVIGIIALGLLLVSFIKFGSHCRSLYGKFKSGIQVELPRADYRNQSSVSSMRALHPSGSYLYDMDDYSVPSGLAKQHSQDSTADSGRGSLSHDHSYMPRSSSDDSNEVFTGKSMNGHPSGHRGRLPSEPVSSYARLMHHESIPEQSSESSIGPASPVRANHSPGHGPLKTSSPDLTSGQRQLATSQGLPASGSIQNYVVVGENSQPIGSFVSNDGTSRGDQTGPNVSGSTVPDYMKASSRNVSPETRGSRPSMTKGNDNPNPSPQYIASPEEINRIAPSNLDYVGSPDAINENSSPSHGKNLQTNSSGYVPNTALSNSPPPSARVTNASMPTALETKLQKDVNPASSPDNMRRPGADFPIDPSGYVTSPSMVDPTGYLASPNMTNPVNPSGYVTSAGMVDPTAYVASPNVTNPTSPSGYVASPSVVDPASPSDYVTNPNVTNSTKLSGHMMSPAVTNPANPPGYVANPAVSPEYMTSPDATHIGGSAEYVRSSEIEGASTPGYVTSPPVDSSCPAGYVASPDVVGPVNNPEFKTSPNVVDPAGTPGYVTIPELEARKQDHLVPSDPVSLPVHQSNDEQTNISNNVSPSGYVNCAAASKMVNDTDPLDETFFGRDVVPEKVRSDLNQSPNDNEGSTLNAHHQPQLADSNPYVSLPPDGPPQQQLSSLHLEGPPSQYPGDEHNLPSPHYDTIHDSSQRVSHSCDTNDNNISKADTYSHLDAPMDAEETDCLLPSRGSRKVLKKSGYVDIGT